ncbi:hypothetical protein Mpal_2617 [Methanosphaerula palustris E1-9c]|uniref:Uncharacterized protein n=1 Tax=Methanosphaerula palustris (strain ATCC BAA-1556 / DSM 19958 / E1-9c) TaxID=521011 RepID=B8GF80_METPE|nr:hypothetical protein Mpal_2617 [Methanosphaerula palustris E1-9c]
MNHGFPSHFSCRLYISVTGESGMAVEQDDREITVS